LILQNTIFLYKVMSKGLHICIDIVPSSSVCITLVFEKKNLILKIPVYNPNASKKEQTKSFEILILHF
jgi:hypothetical protein